MKYGIAIGSARVLCGSSSSGKVSFWFVSVSLDSSGLIRPFLCTCGSEAPGSLCAKAVVRPTPPLKE